MMMRKDLAVTTMMDSSSVVRFDYPAAPEEDSPWKEWEQSVNGCSSEDDSAHASAAPLQVDLDALKSSAFDAGFAQGFDAGREQDRTARNSESSDRNVQLASAVDAFAAARDQILESLEPEVVRL